MFSISLSKSQQPTQKITPKLCVEELSSGDSVLTATIKGYLKYVDNHEIPIVAVETKGDTTHYFISAFIWTNSIKKNPPTSIVIFAGREALLYTGKGSIVQTAPACYQYLLKKYTRLLHIDKLNRSKRLPADNDLGFSYDPISADIMISKDGHVTTKNGPFPYIEHK
ncbi:hypothetical protein GCM10028818_45450 [Spirosoma horti]